jgi:ribosomal subunit interface protein
MKVIVTARHAKFNTLLKDAARVKARHLERFFDHLKKIEVIFDVDGDSRYMTEMIASGLHDHILVTRARDKTALGALDRVLEKMERLLIKYKEKLTRKGDHRTPRKATAATREGSADVWW